jgi:hypothetical protein
MSGLNTRLGDLTKRFDTMTGKQGISVHTDRSPVEIVNTADMTLAGAGGGVPVKITAITSTLGEYIISVYENGRYLDDGAVPPVFIEITTPTDTFQTLKLLDSAGTSAPIGTWLLAKKVGTHYEGSISPVSVFAKIKSGSGGTYLADIYLDTSNLIATGKTVYILQIATTCALPVNTWISVQRSTNGNYYGVVPVWLKEV